jgi:hypothetical protein
MRAIKAVKATEELGPETIGGPLDFDEIFAERVCRDVVDGLIDECINNLVETVSRIRNGERFHAHILPNIRSPPYGFNTDKRGSWTGYSHLRQ